MNLLRVLLAIACLFLPLSEVAAKTNKQYASLNSRIIVERIVKKRFAKIPILVDIAECESSFRQFAEDGTVLKGVVDERDTGVMQINTYYHGEAARELGLDLGSLEDNLTYAKRLFDEEGTRPWNASRHCWSRRSN